MKNILIVICLLGFSVSSYAGFSNKLSKAVEHKIAEGQAFIQALEAEENSGSDWLLSRIRLLSYGLIKFEIPFVEFKIMPMVEGRWVKKHPGRDLYRPDGV